MNYAIETIDLTKEFSMDKGLFNFLMSPRYRRKNITALKGVNLQIRKGEIFGLVGPNHAGKTTLIKILSTLILPTRGSAFVNGYDVIKDENKVKSSISLITSEQRSPYWRLTGRQNMEFYAALYHLSIKEFKKRMDSLIDLLALDEDIDKQVMRYSTGMRQRLCLARGLLSDAEVLFMDEPTKSLDIEVARNLRNFISDELVRKMGKTVLFTTHQPYEAETLSDRLAIIDNGEIKVTGGLYEIRQGLNTPDATFEEIFMHYTKD